MSRSIPTLNKSELHAILSTCKGPGGEWLNDFGRRCFEEGVKSMGGKVHRPGLELSSIYTVIRHSDGFRLLERTGDGYTVALEGSAVSVVKFYQQQCRLNDGPAIDQLVRTVLEMSAS